MLIQPTRSLIQLGLIISNVPIILQISAFVSTFLHLLDRSNFYDIQKSLFHRDCYMQLRLYKCTTSHMNLFLSTCKLIFFQYDIHYSIGSFQCVISSCIIRSIPFRVNKLKLFFCCSVIIFGLPLLKIRSEVLFHIKY